MTKLNERTNNIILINSTTTTSKNPVLYPFALEDLLAQKAAEINTPILHIWKHPRALVLGLRDRRLTHADKAIQAWIEDGYSVAVRHSGGAAVPLDQDVINMTLIFPKAAGNINFNSDFETMYQLLREMITGLQYDQNGQPQKLNVCKGEILGSFCPGDYDLSIQGRKFCGMAQRRQVRALAIQAFVLLRGKGVSRTRLARQFYQQAASVKDIGNYPTVIQSSMGSLEELFGDTEPTEHFHLSDQRWLDALYQVLRNQTVSVVEKSVEKWIQDEDISKIMQQIKKRYEG